MVFCKKVTGAFVQQSNYQLSSWNTYYHPPITLCTSMIGSFIQNCSLSFCSVMENPKKYSTKPDQSMSLLSKNHPNVEEIMNFEIKYCNSGNFQG